MARRRGQGRAANDDRAIVGACPTARHGGSGRLRRDRLLRRVRRRPQRRATRRRRFASAAAASTPTTTASTSRLGNPSSPQLGVAGAQLRSGSAPHSRHPGQRARVAVRWPGRDHHRYRHGREVERLLPAGRRRRGDGNPADVGRHSSCSRRPTPAVVGRRRGLGARHGQRVLQPDADRELAAWRCHRAVDGQRPAVRGRR